jgi:hypothetical protein
MGYAKASLQPIKQVILFHHYVVAQIYQGLFVPPPQFLICPLCRDPYKEPSVVR